MQHAAYRSAACVHCQCAMKPKVAQILCLPLGNLLHNPLLRGTSKGKTDGFMVFVRHCATRSCCAMH